jgi:hypothetical protein
MASACLRIYPPEFWEDVRSHKHWNLLPVRHCSSILSIAICFFGRKGSVPLSRSSWLATGTPSQRQPLCHTKSGTSIETLWTKRVLRFYPSWGDYDPPWGCTRNVYLLFLAGPPLLSHHYDVFTKRGEKVGKNCKWYLHFCNGMNGLSNPCKSFPDMQLK